MYAATNGTYTLFLVEDDEPMNPREDFSPLGSMVCWHRRYCLGDAHDYDEPADFFEDLCRRSGCEGRRRLVQLLKEKRARNAYLAFNPETGYWDLYAREDWTASPEWEVVQSATDEQLETDAQFFDAMLEWLTLSEMKNLLKAWDGLLLFPLYLYDHSIQSISIGSFIGRAQHAEWDSGQVGYIYAEPTAIQTAYGAISPETMNRARQALEAEVKAYDAYLRGECYGYRLYKDGEEIDSCWGFLGDIDELRDDLRAALPPEGAELVEKLKYTPETEDAYLARHDIV